MALQKLEGAVLLPPSLIDANPDNTRYGLKKSRIKKLMEEIKVAGGIMQPIEVHVVEGGRYEVSFGDYRLAAAKGLVDEGAVDLTIPAIIKTALSGKDAMLRNLMENLGRQDLTLMDQAVAIKKLLDAGVDKLQVRTMFKRPGRKDPVSNSWVNITVGFLELPKKVQNSIHEGQYDWKSAAELVKIQRLNPDKLEDVLMALEEDRNREIERENKEEEKFLNTVVKAEEAEAKAKSAMEAALAKEADKAQKLEDAKAAVQTAKTEGAAKEAELDKQAREKYDQIAACQDSEARKKLISESASIQKDLGKAKDETEKAILKAQKALDGLIDKEKAEGEATKKKAAEAKEEAKTAKTAAVEAKKDKQPGNTAKKKAEEKPISQAAVAKAAKTVGVPLAGGKVPLNRKDIMAYVAFLKLEGGSGKAETMVKRIGQALENAFNSVLTDKQLYTTLLGICSGK